MIKEKVLQINGLCNQFRIDLIKLLHSIQTGHPGGSLSSAEIITALYSEIMYYNHYDPNNPDRDRFVLSKGHAAPMLYLNLAHNHFFPKEDLKTLRQLGSHLQGHPCAHKTPGIDVSTGPLGLGLSAGLGIALAGRLQRRSYYTYVLLGDGEIQEGGIWEAAMSAVKFQADHLIVFLDHNGVQLDGTNEEIMPMGDICWKFSSFGWNVLTCNGHDVEEIVNAVEKAKKTKNIPTIIVAETVKGKGVSFMDGKNIWHGKAISAVDCELALKELGGALNG